MEFEELESAAPADVVDQQSGGAQDTGTQANEETAEVADSGAEDRARNARMAAARRTGEKAERDRANRAFADLGIVGTDGKAIGSMEDALNYFRGIKEQGFQAESKKTGKPVEQLRAEDEERTVGRRQLSEERSEREKADFIRQDIAEFTAVHGDVDVQKLLNEGRFQRFCGSRLGKESLTELYEDYTYLNGEARNEGRQQTAAKQSRGTGSGSGATDHSLSAAQQRALDEWNAAYPGMKMTAKEFFER